MQPEVAIVIPTWNRCQDLLECLASVDSLDYPHIRIVVVDNASTDDTTEMVRKHYPKIDLLILEKNHGAVGASNAGISHALPWQTPYILRIDSDTLFAPDFLTQLIHVMESDSQIGAVVGKALYHRDPYGETEARIWSLGAKRTSWFFDTIDLGKGQVDAGQFTEIQPIDYAWSAGILLSRRAIEITGGFDPDFFVYFEEMDLCERIRKGGLKILSVPNAVMWHKVGELAHGKWVAYQWARGKMLFFRKHSQGLHRWALILYSYGYALLRAVWRKQGAGNRGPLRAAWAGLTAGWRYECSA